MYGNDVTSILSHQPRLEENRGVSDCRKRFDAQHLHHDWIWIHCKDSNLWKKFVNCLVYIDMCLRFRNLDSIN